MRMLLRSVPLELPGDARPIDLEIPGLGPPDRVLLRDGDGLASWGAAMRIPVGVGPDRFRTAAEALQTIASEVRTEGGDERPEDRLVAIGSLAFAEDDPGSVLVVPSHVVIRRGGHTWMTTLLPADAPTPPRPVPTRPPAVLRDRVRFGGATVDDVTWLAAADEVIRRIGDGRLEKLVLARDQHVWCREPFDLHALVHALAQRFPSCTTFRVDGLVGASPEPLLTSDGLNVSSRVLAGTTARSTDPTEDERLGAALRSSAKDRHEHTLAVASVVDALGASVTALEVDPEPRILRLANVQHLATDVTGTLTAPIPSLELVARLHPTAAVGGTPRTAALATLREVEGMSRSRYAGPIGWTTAAGDGEWAIALRCGLFEGGRGRLFAGAGIVAGSRPEDELTETWLKLAAVRGVLEDGSAARRPRGG